MKEKRGDSETGPFEGTGEFLCACKSAPRSLTASSCGSSSPSRRLLAAGGTFWFSRGNTHRPESRQNQLLPDHKLTSCSQKVAFQSLVILLFFAPPTHTHTHTLAAIFRSLKEPENLFFFLFVLSLPKHTLSHHLHPSEPPSPQVLLFLLKQVCF